MRTYTCEHACMRIYAHAGMHTYIYLHMTASAYAHIHAVHVYIHTNTTVKVYNTFACTVYIPAYGNYCSLST
jgi:hypothetical protein